MRVPVDNNPITSPRRERRDEPAQAAVLPFPSAARPSEAQMLMALATMHQLGRIKVAESDPRSEKQFQEEGWQTNWGRIVPYGSPGATHGDKGEALKELPDGWEYIDMPEQDQSKGVHGNIYMRPKPKAALTS